MNSLLKLAVGAALFFGIATARDLSLEKTALKGHCKTYHKIVKHGKHGECGDACLPSKLGKCPRSIVASRGKLTAGSCKGAGYTTDTGKTQLITAASCGTFTIKEWTNAKVAKSSIMVEK